MEDEKYMRRCIQLARNGLCNAAPNPMVGAVIVHDGRIIGEGYHVRCGQAHAEVNAVRSVREPALLKEATLYVSLEPCAHYGKTPPCADMIVEKQIPRIVVGCQDPFAKVAGRGIQKLRDAGREVVVGVLEDECRALIRRFITFHTRRRPYITLKWAESADGFIDRLRTDGHPTVLSSPLTAMLVHKMRAEHAAILVGTDTARLDNPSLNVRHWYGPAPVRVTIDRHHRLPQDLHLFDGSSPTLVYTRESLEEILADLYDRQLQSLLVEGGSRLHQSFIDAGLWDEIMVEEAPVRLGEGVSAPVVSPRIPYRRECHFGRFYRHYLAAETCPDTPAESLF
ncbi:bifunctional diaminohydroxyphosphoribosylaminopyrimidine deaminase/5-amino-6-(5-phosphoribosylamino)uracil reductase RibD [Mediterranea massiliensis]|uniref:bifunctional diaminohydroxyphosphoribosylaminopyrimidine deaminase/5-amino-6-(5-phosphoribosylamino)uracil reductase RibD n=1 Tax=Mediterranea massiliensis TaxID=1841865 RepID=UPI00266CF13C|nr:bifunctional diaminohydroxyphosphoribosylaminopyrimidine deaminase/5-amino-6-(5-phosphoribosylamino)uracil reductase RibD [Mediterranea massiliensis]